jgi:hypothetical protein
MKIRDCLSNHYDVFPEPINLRNWVMDFLLFVCAD